MQRVWRTLVVPMVIVGCSSDPVEEASSTPSGSTISSTLIDSSTGSVVGEDGAVGVTTLDGAMSVNVDDGGTSSEGDSGVVVPEGPVNYGEPFTGGVYHLGPVDYEETVWRNACDPGAKKYAPAIQAVEGKLLAGLWDGIPNVAGYCDACIRVTTAKGKTALLRVVTYGATTKNSIDVSPEAYKLLNVSENPRNMTWQFAKCEDTGKLYFEFQTGAHEDWTSFWIRNARVPITKVEVKSVRHASFFALRRGSDGTLNDDKGFGKGAFTLQLTGMDGSIVTESFDWPATGVAGKTLTGLGNFK